MITKDQLHCMIPDANSKLIDKFHAPLCDAMLEYQVNVPLRIAAFIAQITHESGSLHYVEEIASGSAYENRKDLGNLLPEALDAAHAKGTTTGKFYKGHGLIQITGFYNHKKCGEALGIDLVNEPMLLSTPTEACRSAAWFWKTHGCNELADAGLFGAITKVINGGHNGAKERLLNFARNKKVLDIK